MEEYISEEQVSNYFKIPQNFDWYLVDQEVGFGKIFDVFPKEVYLSLEAATEPEQEIYKFLTKAGVYYSFIFSIPKLKVQITNYGIQEFSQDKIKSSPWWDVRDLGISMLKVADKCLSDAITKTAEIETLKDQVPFFANLSEFFPTPEQFQSIYSINYSTEVFLKLQKFINKALLILVYEKIKPGCLDQIKKDPTLLSYLQDALAFYSLYYASLLPDFIFTQNAVVIQYDELPWQKSIVLDAHAKTLAGMNFQKLGDDSIKLISNYIKANAIDFPCYTLPTSDRKMQARDSGIYL